MTRFVVQLDPSPIRPGTVTSTAASTMLILVGGYRWRVSAGPGDSLDVYLVDGPVSQMTMEPKASNRIVLRPANEEQS